MVCPWYCDSFFFFIFLLLETNLVCDEDFLIFSRAVCSLLYSGESIEELPKCEYKIVSQAYFRNSIHSPANDSSWGEGLSCECSQKNQLYVLVFMSCRSMFLMCLLNTVSSLVTETHLSSCQYCWANILADGQAVFYLVHHQNFQINSHSRVVPLRVHILNRNNNKKIYFEILALDLGTL